MLISVNELRETFRLHERSTRNSSLRSRQYFDATLTAPLARVPLNIPIGLARINDQRFITVFSVPSSGDNRIDL